MNFENMWSVKHGHTDIMYVFASRINLRGYINRYSPVSGSSLFPSCALSRLRSRGLTSSAGIIISRKKPWRGELVRHVLTSYFSGLVRWLITTVHLEVQNRVKQQYWWQFDDRTGLCNSPYIHHTPAVSLWCMYATSSLTSLHLLSILSSWLPMIFSGIAFNIFIAWDNTRIFWSVHPCY